MDPSWPLIFQIHPASDSLKTSLALVPQVHDLFLERLDHLLALVNACSEFAALAPPARDPVDLSRSSSLLCVNFFAKLAFLADLLG